MTPQLRLCLGPPGTMGSIGYRCQRWECHHPLRRCHRRLGRETLQPSKLERFSGARGAAAVGARAGFSHGGTGTEQQHYRLPAWRAREQNSALSQLWQDAWAWRQCPFMGAEALQETFISLFTSCHLPDPSDVLDAISKGPCTAPGGPRSHPSSAGSPLLAGRCWQHRGSAHGCHLPFRQH